MDPITLIFWQIIALLLAGMVICGLLILVFDQRESLRDARDKAAGERTAHRKARAEACDLYAQIEQLNAALEQGRLEREDLTEALVTQQELIETFIHNGLTDLEDRT